jgi:hypothetical protein
MIPFILLNSTNLANEALSAELTDDIAVVDLLEVLAELALTLELNPTGQAGHGHVHTVHCNQPNKRLNFHNHGH